MMSSRFPGLKNQKEPESLVSGTVWPAPELGTFTANQNTCTRKRPPFKHSDVASATQGAAAANVRAGAGAVPADRGLATEAIAPGNADVSATLASWPWAFSYVFRTFVRVSVTVTVYETSESAP